MSDARSLLPAHALAASAAGEAARLSDRRLTRREEAKLLAPLLRLRQACCHPQVGGLLVHRSVACGPCKRSSDNSESADGSQRDAGFVKDVQEDT